MTPTPRIRASAASLILERSDLLPNGTSVWKRGNEVIAISTVARRDWLRLFGMQPEMPADATTVVLSPADYDELLAALLAAQDKPAAAGGKERA